MKIKVNTKFNRLGVTAILIIVVLYMVYKLTVSILPAYVYNGFMALFGFILMALVAHTLEILEDTKHENKED